MRRPARRGPARGRSAAPSKARNGIAYFEGDLYVTNSEKGLIVRIPVNPDGSAGEPEQVAGGEALFGLDGLEVDVHGRLYAALNVQNRVIRVDPGTGEVTDVAGAAGEPDPALDFPASLAFGTARGMQKTLFITNYALLDDGTDPTLAGPGIAKMEVGVPGRPLP